MKTKQKDSIDLYIISAKRDLKLTDEELITRQEIKIQKASKDLDTTHANISRLSGNPGSSEKNKRRMTAIKSIKKGILRRLDIINRIKNG